MSEHRISRSRPREVYDACYRSEFSLDGTANWQLNRGRIRVEGLKVAAAQNTFLTRTEFISTSVWGKEIGAAR